MSGPLPDGDEAPENGLFSKTEIQGHESRSFHAYVHIPFCKDICGYCDFNTYTATQLGTLKQSDYARSLISEIAFSAQVLEKSGVAPRKFTTVFFGGGTPSLLPAADLVEILAALSNQFGFIDDAEITTEANPDTVTLEKFTELREAGFNRVSIGMQSGVQSVLNTLERTHNPENVAKAFEIVKGLGFGTSLDLIFGAPGETLDQWRESLEAAIELAPDHLSAYSLIVEPGTKLARQINSSELAEVDEDLQAEKYELTEALLSKAGYRWYEISNWSKSESLQSNHNLAYWMGQDWWGYGPGAHSHLGAVRWWNQKHPLTYSKKLEGSVSPAAGREQLSAETAALERVLLESRTSNGMSISDLVALEPGAKEKIPQLIADGLIQGEQALKGQLVLTVQGRLLADAVVRVLTD
jgi:putative oxygen-independent coproporphyrinogen III oxidase